MLSTSFIGGYGLLVLLSLSIYSVSFVTFLWGSMRASRLLHDKLISSILGTTLRWLDVVPVSRVIARATQDIRSLDGPLGNNLGEVVEWTFAIVSRLGAIILVSPVFVLPSFLVAYIGWFCGQLYIKSQLSVKREMSLARAPVIGYVGVALQGLSE